MNKNTKNIWMGTPGQPGSRYIIGVDFGEPCGDYTAFTRISKKSLTNKTKYVMRKTYMKIFLTISIFAVMIILITMILLPVLNGG